MGGPVVADSSAPSTSCTGTGGVDEKPSEAGADDGYQSDGEELEIIQIGPDHGVVSSEVLEELEQAEREQLLEEQAECATLITLGEENWDRPRRKFVRRPVSHPKLVARWNSFLKG